MENGSRKDGQVGKRAVGLFMIVRGGLPGMFGSCKADLTKRRIRPRPRARAPARSLWAGNIETQDVLLCHPRAGDLLVMNIVAHGGTWPARPRGVLPKYVRRLACSTFLFPLPCARPYSFRDVTWTSFYSRKNFETNSAARSLVINIYQKCFTNARPEKSSLDRIRWLSIRFLPFPRFFFFL